MKSKRRPARIINIDQPFRGDILLDETSEYIKLLSMMRIIFKSSYQSCTDRFLVTFVAVIICQTSDYTVLWFKFTDILTLRLFD